MLVLSFLRYGEVKCHMAEEKILGGRSLIPPRKCIYKFNGAGEKKMARFKRILL